MNLFVNARRQQMHSDVGYMLDLRTEKVVWTRRKAEFKDVFSWGYAGTTIAAFDIIEDHRDEISSLYPVCYWVADGRSGELLIGKDLASRKSPPAWAAYGEPLVHDLDGDGRPEILLDSPYILAALNISGDVLWHGPPRDDFPTSPDQGNVGETTRTKHALIDINGDGVFEFGSAGYGDGVRIMDARTGKVLWSLEAPTPACHKVAAADIDGIGGDELLYVANDTLVAITGNRTGGRVLWTWKAPASLSMPAIADTDGDGLAEIVMQAADGTVYCLDDDNAPAARKTSDRKSLPSSP
jgi:outer membrane protein assembly factor BamB